MTTKKQRIKLIELGAGAFQGPFSGYVTMIYSECEKANIAEMSEPYATGTIEHRRLEISSHHFEKVNFTRDYLALAGTCAADLAREVDNTVGMMLGTAVGIIENLIGLVSIESDLDAEDFSRIRSELEMVKEYLKAGGWSEPKKGEK